MPCHCDGPELESLLHHLLPLIPSANSHPSLTFLKCKHGHNNSTDLIALSWGLNDSMVPQPLTMPACAGCPLLLFLSLGAVVCQQLAPFHLPFQESHTASGFHGSLLCDSFLSPLKLAFSCNDLPTSVHQSHSLLFILQNPIKKDG